MTSERIIQIFRKSYVKYLFTSSLQSRFDFINLTHYFKFIVLLINLLYLDLFLIFQNKRIIFGGCLITIHFRTICLSPLPHRHSPLQFVAEPVAETGSSVLDG